MRKNIYLLVAAVFLLSGCSITGKQTALPGSSVSAPGSIYKSFDSGDSFVPKVTVNDTLRISSADVLSWAFESGNPQTMYVGTLTDGIFRTEDGAEHWEKMNYPPEKVYGLVLDPSHAQRIFATGVYEKVARVYYTEDAGEDWKEVYAEPGPGTVITALAMHPSDSRILYAATDKGVVIKSSDGGARWENIYEAKGAVSKILLGSKSPESVALLVFQKSVIVSPDGGATWRDMSTRYDTTSSSTNQSEVPKNPVSLLADPKIPNILYVGTSDGLFRSKDFGLNWHALPIIESAKQYPIRAVAVNPNNGNEIVFASGQVLYRTIDGGQQWSTTALGIARGVSIILYEPGNPAILYLGLRNFK